jgi:competence protein ComEA
VYEKLRQFKWQDGLLAAGLALMTVGVGFGLKSKLDNTNVEVIKAKISPTVTVNLPTTIAVDIEGEVIHPGVYKINRGSRVEDGLIAAGGLSANADREWVEKNLNRAEVVVDGMKVYIPMKNESVPTTGVVLGSQTKIVRINTATAEQLDTLPGIGPAIAGRIIDYRILNGGFKDINELKMVSGIGDKVYENIKDLIEL